MNRIHAEVNLVIMYSCKSTDSISNKSASHKKIRALHNGDTVLKRTLFLIIAVLTLFAQTAFSQSAETPQDFSKASLNIKFFDRTMYYPGNPEDNPVYVHVSIVNNGTDTIRFKLADDRMFSADFTAYTIKNSTLPQTEALIRKRSTNQTVYFREISIEPGEEYSFVENAKDYLKFEEPSIYYLELTFYPELYKSKNIALVSNRLSLEIHPSPSAASSAVLPVESQTASLLRPEQIPPDKVVEQTIIARQKSLWDQYFLYMDVEQMLKRDQARERKYNLMSADERAEMLRTFKADLMQNRIDHDIVAVPSKFQIDTTNYNQNDGTVTVLEWFKNDTFFEKKRYTYYMEQRDGIWHIYDYTVENLGTE